MGIRTNSATLLIIFLSLGALALAHAQNLPRVGPSPNPNPVSQASIDMVRSLHEEMNCRWRTLGCASTDAPFAVTYLHMTRTVLQGIESQYFDDGDLMANFTLNFAGRYLDAIDSVRHCSQTSTEAWMEAFTYGDSKKSSVTEDTFLGMNAHIVSFNEKGIPVFFRRPCPNTLCFKMLCRITTYHWLSRSYTMTG